MGTSRTTQSGGSQLTTITCTSCITCSSCITCTCCSCSPRPCQTYSPSIFTCPAYPPLTCTCSPSSCKTCRPITSTSSCKTYCTITCSCPISPASGAGVSTCPGGPAAPASGRNPPISSSSTPSRVLSL